jgi:hypothetical protein
VQKPTSIGDNASGTHLGGHAHLDLGDPESPFTVGAANGTFLSGHSITSQVPQVTVFSPPSQYFYRLGRNATCALRAATVLAILRSARSVILTTPHHHEVQSRQMNTLAVRPVMVAGWIAQVVYVGHVFRALTQVSITLMYVQSTRAVHDVFLV